MRARVVGSDGMTGDAPGSQTNPALQLATAEVPSEDALIKLLGRPFLAYVCNATDEEVATRVADGSPFPNVAQEDVFGQTLEAARTLAANRSLITVNNEPALEPMSDAFGRFGEHLEARGMSIANALRCAAGDRCPICQQPIP
jgi:hypothetical protein